MPHPRAYPKKERTQSELEVFVIESLAMGDEMKGAYEGRALCDGLRTMGWRPLYHYIRTASEFRDALKLFRHSNYRFLHLSLHGSSSSLFTTLDIIPNAEVAKMAAGMLPNRRLSISACKSGSGSLVNDIQALNKGIESVAAPLDDIDMKYALPFWLSFYIRALKEGGLNFKETKLRSLLQPLCIFFGFRLNWSHWTPVGEKWGNDLLK